MDKLRAAGVLWVLKKLRTSPIRPRAAYRAVRNGNDVKKLDITRLIWTSIYLLLIRLIMW